MKKRILNILLNSIIFIVAILFTSIAHGQHTLTAIDVEINNKGYITEYKGASSNIIIPENIDGKIIKGIEDGVSKWDGVFANKSIIFLQLPNTIEYIGDFAFYGNGITELIIPKSVRTIGYSAFYYNALSKLIFASNGHLQEIKEYAFGNNLLENLSIPGTVRELGKGAFYINNIDQLYIDNRTVIGGSAFNKNNINRVNDLPSDGIFYQRKGNGDIDDTKIVSYGGGLTELNLSNSNVLRIEGYAFRGNNLTSIILPKNLKFIGENAFSTNYIKSIVIPGSVTIIEEYAFNNNSLTSVEFSYGIERIEIRAFSFNSLTVIVLPSSISYIGSDAFSYNDFTSMKLPIVNIEGKVFDKWTDSATNHYKGDTVVSVEKKWYRALFK